MEYAPYEHLKYFCLLYITYIMYSVYFQPLTIS